MRVLVAGWFSFEDMGTTAGDLMSKNVVCNWLNEGSIDYDVAVAGFPDTKAVDWQKVDPLRYTDLIFVCGPFGNGWPVTEMLTKFSHCRLTGMNLSLLQKLDEWNPFSFLYERDNFGVSYPDLSFAGSAKKVPVVGVILAHKQKEYGTRALHDTANAAINQLVKSREMAVVNIDTVIHNNKGNLRTAAEIESLIAAMDVVVTTRLHGVVLSLKNNVPVIPIDPISGGAKVSLQVRAIGWPVIFSADNLNGELLIKAMDFCMSLQAKEKAKACLIDAQNKIDERRKDFSLKFKQSAVLVH